MPIQLRLAIFKHHSNDLFKVFSEFIQRLPLGMGPWKAGHIPNVKPCLRTFFDNRCI